MAGSFVQFQAIFYNKSILKLTWIHAVNLESLLEVIIILLSCNNDAYILIISLVLIALKYSVKLRYIWIKNLKSRLCWPRNKLNENLTFSGILGRFKGCGVGAVKSAVSLLSVYQVICKVCPNSGTLAEWLA